MADDKRGALLLELIEATEAGRVSWHPTARLNEFTASFKGRFAILVGRDSEGEHYVRLKDIDGRELFSLTDNAIPALTLNAGGPVVTPVVLPVRRLYESIRNSKRETEQAIDEILQELQQ